MQSILGGGAKEESQPLTSGADIKPIYFAPRQPSMNIEREGHGLNGTGDNPNVSGGTATGGGFWSRFFGRSGYQAVRQHKPRKVPVKVEPKVFFANERTFLAWLNMSVTLSSIAIAILAFADHNEFSQIYGFIVLPVAIAFCIYALHTYIRRASMIRRREPGPYEDRVGPVALTVLLVLSILVNMALKFYDITRPESGVSRSIKHAPVPMPGKYSPAPEPVDMPAPAPSPVGKKGKTGKF